MNGAIYIDNEEIGFADFKVVDKSMGVIQGTMTPTESYSKYVKQVQSLCVEKGIANMEDFNFKIILEDKTVLESMGGVGITDASGFEVIVESAGIEYSVIASMDT